MYSVEQIKALIQQGKTEKFYNDKYWRRLSAEIIRENHNECEFCKARGRVSKARLVHHVKYLKYFPHLAYSRYYVDDKGNKIKQLVALCQTCHEEQHPERRNGNVHFINVEKW